MKKLAEGALNPVEIENELRRLVVHLVPYQQEAFVALAACMIRRFEVSRWRAKMKLTYSDIILQALSNFAAAANEARSGSTQKAMESAADAANLLALRLTAGEVEGEQEFNCVSGHRVLPH